MLGDTEASPGREACKPSRGGAVAPQQFKSSHPDCVRSAASQEGVGPAIGLSPSDIENSSPVMCARRRTGLRGHELLFSRRAKYLSELLHKEAFFSQQ